MINLELLKKLCLASGISGCEYQVRDIILKEISGYAEDIKIDNLGNLIVFKKGKFSPKKTLMVCSHMDEVGFIVSRVTKDGYLGFENVGGIDSRIIHGINVLVGPESVPGVIGVKPIHMVNKSERDNLSVSKNLMVDIGAKDREDALRYINIGDPIVFDSYFIEHNGRIRTKAIDDRAGCAILIDTIKQDIMYDAYFAFTVQEEVGLRGAKTAAYNINPDSAIIVESTTAYDIPEVPEEKQICKLNGGPAVSFMDRATIYDREYFNAAVNISNDNGIKSQIKKGVSGGNDSGAIHLSRGGVRTVALSLPCRYLHTPASMISIEDYKSLEKLLVLMMNQICAE